MALKRFADTVEEVTRLVGSAPPIARETEIDGARLTGRWLNPRFDAYIPGMADHVLVAQLAGRGEAYLKRGRRVLSSPSRPGTITFAPVGHDGWRRTATTLEVSNVFLSPERLQACADAVGDGRPVELLDRLNFDDPKLFAVLKLIGEEVGSSEPLSRLMIERLLDVTCLQLLRAHAVFSLPERSGACGGLSDRQVRRVIGHMRDRLGEDIGLQELADLVGLSRFHFCTAFGAATGSSPHAWLTRLRMDQACGLLADTEFRITEIALSVGYQTASSFTAAFRRHTGLTPSQFRRELA